MILLGANTDTFGGNMAPARESKLLVAALKQRKKKNTGIMLAIHPWVFSLALDAMTENYKRDES